MSNVLGWIGSICFALCGLPQAIKCVRQGNTQGLSTLFLTLWSVGSVCYIVAVWTEFSWGPMDDDELHYEPHLASHYVSIPTMATE